MDAELVRDLLDYDPVTGLLHWRKNRNGFGGIKAGDVAGRRDRYGYIIVKIAGRRYRAHHVIWLHVNGVWPPSRLDHKNRVSDANQIENLRPASGQQNSANTGAHRDSLSGIKGVSWNKQRQKWNAKICVGGKRIHLGSFFIKEDAASAYREASLKHHGEYSIFHSHPQATP